MNVTQLIKRVRRSAFIEDGSIDWTNANIVEELNDTFSALFERVVLKADSGIWHETQYYALVANQAQYRLPDRAAAGTIARVQISAVSPVDWYDLDEIGEDDAIRYETLAEDMPQRCIIRGETLQMLPAPKLSNQWVVRVQYALRPGRMCLPQSNSSAGVITAINTSTRTLTLAAPQFSIDDTGAATAQSSGKIDIIKPNGWYSCVWTGTGTNTSGSPVVLDSDATGLSEANDLSMIAVGDVLRFAEQTDWPAIPAEFHRALADATAAKILTARGMADRASELMAHVSPDLKRFESLTVPRAGTNAHVFVAPRFV